MIHITDRRRLSKHKYYCVFTKGGTKYISFGKITKLDTGEWHLEDVIPCIERGYYTKGGFKVELLNKLGGYEPDVEYPYDVIFEMTDEEVLKHIVAENI